jgi:hypothetical protein
MSLATFTFPEYASWLKKAGPVALSAMKRGALSGAYRCVPILVDSTRTAPSAAPGHAPYPGGAVNTGAYLRSWKASATERGAIIQNIQPYSGVIEFGRRAGSRFPPPDAIKRWAQRRLQLSEDDAKRIAYPIARAIAKRGLVGRRVMTSVLPKLQQVFNEEVAKELNRALGTKL